MNSNLLIRGEHYVTDGFGYRLNPVTGKPEGHNGTDYGTNRKKIPCYAIGSGIVLRVGVDKYGANFVYVKFTKQRKVGLYYHLDKVSVKKGQAVTKDTQIGIIGDTGQSTAVHLHFSLIEDNERAMLYYKADYINFETYTMVCENENAEKVKAKFGFDDETINYLEAYKDAEQLLAKMLLPDQYYSLKAIKYILCYKYGKELFLKLI